MWGRGEGRDLGKHPLRERGIEQADGERWQKPKKISKGDGAVGWRPGGRPVCGVGVKAREGCGRGERRIFHL